MGPACLLLAFSLAGGSPQPVDLDQYTRTVHSIRLSLDRAAQNLAVTPISGIQGQLRSLHTVRLPDGRLVRSGLPLLATEMAPGRPNSVQRAAAAVDMLDSLIQSAPRRTADLATLQSLDTVLKDLRFHPARPPWAPIADKIEELRRRLIAWLFSGVQQSTGTTGIFAIFLLLLVAGFGYLLARDALGRLVVDAETEEESGSPTTSVTAEERAQGSAATGDYRQALRYLFLSTMLVLQERGALELRTGMTNREYLRVLREFRPGNEELQQALDSLVDAFDDAWYGHLAFGAQDFDRCRSISLQIQRAAAREAA